MASKLARTATADGVSARITQSLEQFSEDQETPLALQASSFNVERSTLGKQESFNLLLIFQYAGLSSVLLSTCKAAPSLFYL